VDSPNPSHRLDSAHATGIKAQETGPKNNKKQPPANGGLD